MVSELLRLFLSFLQWAILLPLAYLVPKKRNLLIFPGIYKGQFVGNVKYFFIYTHRQHSAEVEYYYLTEYKSLYNELIKRNVPTLYYPSFKAIFKMLRAGIIFVDSNNWVKNFKYDFLINSRKIQLWHGIGIKKIELQLFDNKKPSILQKLQFYFKGRYPCYDIVISPSEYFTQNRFATAFNAKRIIETGLPRNDIFFAGNDELTLLGIDERSYQKIKEAKAKKMKIILYAPTFRDTQGDAISDGALDINQLDRFAENNNILFVFKFHPGPRFKKQMVELKNIINYQNSQDVYPLMALFDLLITDYSGIFMDYILLNRPLVFFAYDYEKYIMSDREIQFDYNWITPGPKCFKQQELEHVLYQILINGHDEYAEHRKEIIKIGHKYQDGLASQRIWEFVNNEFIKQRKGVSNDRHYTSSGELN